MKHRVLFVDDEPHVLDGLRRNFHAMRGKWDMAFVGGGKEAMALMEDEPYDVVVADMRMPGMDGAALLSAVRERHPRTARLILSGHSDREMVLRTVRPAHQFLQKPCDAREILSAIERVLGLRDILGHEGVGRVVSRVETLPSLPRLYLDLLSLLAREDASVKDIAGVIGRDVSMATGVLKLVNSAFFGQRERVGDIGHAVNLLGIETIKACIMSLHLFSLFDPSRYPGLSPDRLWEHGLRAGFLARTLCETEGAGRETVEDAAIAGLLHDLGKIVLAANFEADYQATLAVCRAEGKTVREAEAERFGVTHAEVGGYLLGLWGFSDRVARAVFYHHDPSAHDCREFCPLAAVHLANWLDHDLVVLSPGYAKNSLDDAFLRSIGLSERLPLWREACAERLRDSMEAANES